MWWKIVFYSAVYAHVVASWKSEYVNTYKHIIILNVWLVVRWKRLVGAQYFYKLYEIMCIFPLCIYSQSLTLATLNNRMVFNSFCVHKFPDDTIFAQRLIDWMFYVCEGFKGDDKSAVFHLLETRREFIHGRRCPSDNRQAIKSIVDIISLKLSS